LKENRYYHSGWEIPYLRELTNFYLSSGDDSGAIKRPFSDITNIMKELAKIIDDKFKEIKLINISNSGSNSRLCSALYSGSCSYTGNVKLDILKNLLYLYPHFGFFF